MPKIEMTAQEIFNKVGLHLLMQGKKSEHVDEDGYERCMYRSPEGTMCAVGCLIPDDVYDRRMENSNARKVNSDFNLFGEEHEDLLMDLQRIHDSDHPMSWSMHLYVLSQTRNLDWDEFTGYIWENSELKILLPSPS